MAPATKPSEPEAVTALLDTLDHPRKPILEALRTIILDADPEVGEEVKWNAPTFFYTGVLEPTDPKLYTRYLVISNFFRTNCIRLVFWQGALVSDPEHLLSGDYSDGRRLAEFHSMEEVVAKKSALQQIVREQIATIKNGNR